MPSNFSSTPAGNIADLITVFGNGQHGENYTESPYTNSTNSTTPASSSFSHRHMIGMLLALGGNLLISISLSVQKKAHNRLGHESQFSYCVDKWWWLGMILMVVGELGNFMAYGFAPASLVAPLGSVAVIANSIIAVIFLREPLTMPSIMGVTLVVVGSITLISFSVKGKPPLTSAQIVEYLKAWQFLLYIGLEFVVFVVLLYLKYVRHNEHMVVLLLLVGLIASVTVIASKALSTLISETIVQGHWHVLNPIFWVSLVILPITTATQIRFLNRAMQLYDVSDVAPVNFIFFTVSAILAGAMFYQEFSGVGFDRVFMFLFGCILSFAGVYAITQQDEYKSKDETEVRERSATGDSGLDPGCSSSDTTNSSFSSTSIFSGDEIETPTIGKVTVHKSPQSVAGEKERLVSSSNVSTSVEPLRTCVGLVKDLVSHLKASEQISLVQPSDEEVEKSYKSQ